MTQTTSARVDKGVGSPSTGSTAPTREVKCTFCERTGDQAFRFVQAPPPHEDVLICSSCVSFCVQIAMQDLSDSLPGKVIKRYLYKITELPYIADAVDPVLANSAEPTTREK